MGILNGKWKDYNKTGPPKISASVPLEGSGIISLSSVVATVEDNFWVNVTKEKPKPNATKANGTANATDNSSNSSDAATPEATEEAVEGDDAGNDSNSSN